MGNFTVLQSVPVGQPKARTVSISGSMTIQHGAEIKAALVQAMANGGAVLLDLEKVTAIDLVGLQFVCSTHRALTAQRKRFFVMKSDNQTIAEVAQAAGFNRHTGCAEDIDHTCIWAGGGQ